MLNVVDAEVVPTVVLTTLIWDVTDGGIEVWLAGSPALAKVVVLTLMSGGGYIVKFSL